MQVLYPPTLAMVTVTFPPLISPPHPVMNALVAPAQSSVPMGRKARLSPSVAALPLMAMAVETPW